MRDSLEGRLLSRWKQILTFSFIVAFVIIVVGWLILWWQNQKVPQDIALSFIEAIQKQDEKTVFSLIHPTEKQKLGLTEQKVKQLLQSLVLPLWQRLGKPTDIKLAENPFMPSTPEEEIFFRDFRFFRIMRGDKEGALILVTKTVEGWRVNFSMFLYTLLGEAVERGHLSRGSEKVILLRSGIFQIFVGQEILPLPP
jgi:hypothetical protein